MAYPYDPNLFNTNNDITQTLINGNSFFVNNGTYFRVYRDSNGDLNIYNGNQSITPSNITMNERYFMPNHVTKAGVFRLAVGNNNYTNPTQDTPLDPQIPDQINGEIYLRTSGTTIKDAIDGIIPIQQPNEINTTIYYIYASIIPGSADWVIYRQTIDAPCIHPDMVVDTVNMKISEIDNIHNDPGFCENLKLGFADTFIKIPKNVFGNGIPTADLLLTPKHPITFNGIEIKSEELLNIFPTVKKIKLQQPTMVYTLAFNTRKTIKMHGVDVWQWDINDFGKFCEKQNYVYDGYLKKISK